MVTWAEIDDFAQDLDDGNEPLKGEAGSQFKDLIVRICKEGFEDAHGKRIFPPQQKGELKAYMLDWIQMELDLSKYPKEVSDYVFDQIEDRLGDSLDIMEIVEATEIETDYENQKITLSALFPEVIQKIIQEKEADIEYERRHGERE